MPKSLSEVRRDFNQAVLARAGVAGAVMQSESVEELKAKAIDALNNVVAQTEEIIAYERPVEKVGAVAKR